jgi:hypothetical protein
VIALALSSGKKLKTMMNLMNLLKRRKKICKKNNSKISATKLMITKMILKMMKKKSLQKEKSSFWKCNNGGNYKLQQASSLLQV